MIKLDVFEYCHDCPDFKADVDINPIVIHDCGCVCATDTIIRCTHREKCRKIAEYMAKRNGIKIN